MRYQTFLKFILLCVVTNLLVACVGPDGATSVTPWEWWTNSGPAYNGFDGTAPFTTLFSAVGSLLTGPYGVAAGIIGVGIPAYAKNKKKDSGIGGIVQGVQAGRAALTPAQRKAFDGAARATMSEVVKGNPREMVRKAKTKLKAANEISSERLSDKHALIDAAKKAASLIQL